jgi:hypothetical protein
MAATSLHALAGIREKRHSLRRRGRVIGSASDGETGESRAPSCIPRIATFEALASCKAWKQLMVSNARFNIKHFREGANLELGTGSDLHLGYFLSAKLAWRLGVK